MRLNIGCGEFYRDGWVNVDVTSNDHVKPDVVGSLGAFPLEPQIASRAYLGHVLEHIALPDMGEALSDLRRVLMPGAFVMVVGPDVRRAGILLQKGAIDIEQWRLIREGGDRWDGDAHKWHCHEAKIAALLVAAGFGDVLSWPIKAVDEGWPVVSRAPWQCAVSAVNA